MSNFQAIQIVLQSFARSISIIFINTILIIVFMSTVLFPLKQSKSPSLLILTAPLIAIVAFTSLAPAASSLYSLPLLVTVIITFKNDATKKGNFTKIKNLREFYSRADLWIIMASICFAPPFAALFRMLGR